MVISTIWRKPFFRGLLCGATALWMMGCVTAYAQPRPPSLLQGDEQLACEAVMCLSTSKRPHECEPSIRRYFGISLRKPWKTIEARIRFLELCPISSERKSSLISALANGAGQCDANSLNALLRQRHFDDDEVISDKMPEYCLAYASHEWTRVRLPLYIGSPARGGHWVDPENYETELANYKAQQAREAAQTRSVDGA